MKSHKNFFERKDFNPYYKNKLDIKRDQEGKVHVAMNTSIFDDVKANLLASNSMYASLLTDIQPCLEPYSAKENIVLDIYVTEEPDDFTKESVMAGFKKYVNSCIIALVKQHLFRFFLFFSFLVIGIVIEGVLYGKADVGNNPKWWLKSIEVLGNLFIWQFGGYMAFEYLGESKNIKRYKQIANIEFNIKKWD